jgi:hypothetical protein
VGKTDALVTTAIPALGAQHHDLVGLLQRNQGTLYQRAGGVAVERWIAV